MTKSIIKTKTPVITAIIGALFLISGIIFFLISRNQENLVIYKEMVGDIPPSLVEKIKINSWPVTTLILDNSVPPNKITTDSFTINMPDFLAFLKKLNYVNEGFYLYPAYNDTKKKIEFIVGATKQISASGEKYFLLKTDCNLSGEFVNFVKDVDVIDYYKKYHTKTSITGIDDDNADNPDPNLGKYNLPSRFYSTYDLIAFLRRNEIEYDNANPVIYNKYRVEITGGIITEDISTAIYKYHLDCNLPSNCITNGDCLKGFTCILKILEQDALGNWHYVGSALEIGKPCPPKCGDLIWK